MNLNEIFINYKIIDCSHSLNEKTTLWPGGIHLTVCPFRTYEKDGFSTNVYNISCDLGTHIDSPSHFFKGMRTISDLTTRELISPAVIVDVTSKVEQNADYELCVEDILNWESKFGIIPEKAIVCMKTGWSKKFTDEVAYRSIYFVCRCINYIQFFNL